MKKIKRILLLLFCSTVLFLSSWASLEEFRLFNTFSKLNKDPSLLILINFNATSLLSFLYGIIKFRNIIDVTSNIYKVLRIGDLIFSVTFFISLITGIYYLLNNSVDREFNFYLLRLSIIVLLTLFSVLLFVDNILYHKSQKLLVEKDNIDKIGE